ncbi:MAG: AraC family transcriptional regulator [Clostridia bacterium]|nr:AraC family transcriptional regulator [Clostridia bacterium]
MLYQPILNNRNSPIVTLGEIGNFTVHRHYEVELVYSVKGSYKIILNNEPYLLKEGMMIFIPGFMPHEAVATAENSLQLLIEAGPLFLGDYFDEISSIVLKNPVLDLKASEFGKKINIILSEIIEAKKEFTVSNNLIICGNVTKLFGYFAKEFSAESKDVNIKNANKFKNIEKVLDLIHYNFNENLTIEKAALISGYGKSNFCKIFKNITGISFHQYLNNYRIERSKFYLRNSDSAVFEIAEIVGFNDSKSFCRVFKEITDKTPMEYKAMAQAHKTDKIL